MGELEKLQARVGLPGVQRREVNEGVVREVQGLQQWQSEELGRDRSEVIVGQVHMSDMETINGIFVEKDREEDWERNIPP